MSHSLSAPNSPAVEVVATLGDSVVGVAHVRDPRGGKTSTATRAMIVGGAVAIALGALAFWGATRIASANQAALTAWLANHKPGWSFRPEMVPAWYSVASFLGFSAGLTALVAALARRKREHEPSSVTIGTAAGVDFAIDGTAVPAQALVAPQGDHFVLDLTGMTGEITAADGTHSITPMATALPVTQGMKVRAQLGKVAFHISATDPARRQNTPFLAMLDRRAIGFVAASAAAHLALWAVSRTVPPDASSAQVSMLGDEELSYRFASIEMQEPDPAEIEATDDGEATGQEGLRAMALESGTVGNPKDHSLDPAKRSIKNDNTDPKLARQAALEAARSAGVLGSTALQDGDMFASMIGAGSVSSGLDDLDIEGAMMGDGVGAPTGWGQNLSGNDFGGGGTSYRVGGYNTITDGTRVGDGFGLPNGRGCKATSGLCRGKPDVVPPVKLSPPSVIGGYDASIIRRYVKRKLAQISYCYEKALLATPSLQGTVMAEWTINMSGKATDARAKGVSTEVSSCIAGVVASIEFPKPPQVGVYQVRYPFVLHRQGE